jgi:hypothetical protein
VPLAYRRDESGLVLAEEAMDEARLSRALKEIDDRLVLQKERSSAPGGWTYRVLRIWSAEHPPAPVVIWEDDYGNPLPLTSGILDAVHKHLIGFRGNRFYVDEAEHNRRHVEQMEQRLADELEAIREEHLPRLSDRLSVSMSGRLRRRRKDDSPDGPTARTRLDQ